MQHVTCLLTWHISFRNVCPRHVWFNRIMGCIFLCFAFINLRAYILMFVFSANPHLICLQYYVCPMFAFNCSLLVYTDCTILHTPLSSPTFACVWCLLALLPCLCYVLLALYRHWILTCKMLVCIIIHRPMHTWSCFLRSHAGYLSHVCLRYISMRRVC